MSRATVSSQGRRDVVVETPGDVDSVPENVRMDIFIFWFWWHCEDLLSKKTLAGAVGATSTPGSYVELASYGAGGGFGAGIGYNWGYSGAGFKFGQQLYKEAFGKLASEKMKSEGRPLHDAVRFIRKDARVWVLVDAGGELAFMLKDTILSITGETKSKSVGTGIEKLARHLAHRYLCHVVQVKEIKLCSDEVVVGALNKSKKGFLHRVLSRILFSDTDLCEHLIEVNGKLVKTSQVINKAALVNANDEGGDGEGTHKIDGHGTTLDKMVYSIVRYDKELRDLAIFSGQKDAADMLVKIMQSQDNLELERCIKQAFKRRQLEYEQDTAFIRYLTNSNAHFWGDVDNHDCVDGAQVMHRVTEKYECMKNEGAIVSIYNCEELPTNPMLPVILEAVQLEEIIYNKYKNSVVIVTAEKVSTGLVTSDNQINMIDFPVKVSGETHTCCYVVGHHNLKPEFLSQTQLVVLFTGSAELSDKVRNQIGTFASCSLPRYNLKTRVPISEPNNNGIEWEATKKLPLDGGVFRTESADSFAYKDVSEATLIDMTGGDLIMPSSTQLKTFTCKYIRLEDENHWKIMFQFACPRNKPIHIMTKDQELNLLLNSNRLTDNVLRHARPELRLDKHYLDERSFLSAILLSKLTLISDAIGTGTLIQSLAWRAHETGNTFSFITELPSSEVISTLTDKDAVLKYMLEKACVFNTTAAQVYDHVLLPGGPQAVFYFNVVGNLPETTVSRLKLLAEFDNVHVVLKCDSLFRRELERSFRVLAYDIRVRGIEKHMKILEEKLTNNPSDEVCDLYDNFMNTVMGSDVNVWNFHVLKALEHRSPELASAFETVTSMRKLDAFEIQQVGLLNSNGEFYQSSVNDHLIATLLSDFWFKKLYLELAKVLVPFYVQLLTTTEPEAFDIGMDELYHKSNVMLATDKEHKLVTFTSSSLRFMENNARNAADIRKDEIPKDALKICKKLLSRDLYGSLLGCIEEGFVFQLKILISIAKLCFHAEKLEELISLPEDGRPKDLPKDVTKVYPWWTWSSKPIRWVYRASVAFLLHRAAVKRSPEVTRELVVLFGDSKDNYVRRLCTEFPEEVYSPLDVAIMVNDNITFAYLKDKVSAPAKRLLSLCVVSENRMSEEDVAARVVIFKCIRAMHPNVEFRVSPQDLNEYLKTLTDDVFCNHFLLWSFVRDHHLSLHGMPRPVKRALLTRGWTNGHAIDEILVDMLLIYFCEDGKQARRLVTYDMIVNNRRRGRFTPEQVVNAIDKQEANSIFSGLNFNPVECFLACRRVDTLEVFVGIWPSFRMCNMCGWNYLHCAVSIGNKLWVKYLLAQNYLIEERDNCGCTPIMNIRPGCALEMTQLLLEHNADYTALNYFKYNVAHALFSSSEMKDAENVSNWIRFMLLQENHIKLWSQENNIHETPFELLIRVFGDTHSVVRLLKGNVPNPRMLILRSIVNNYNDEELRAFLLRKYGNKNQTLRGWQFNPFLDRLNLEPPKYSFSRRNQSSLHLNVGTFLASIDIKSAKRAFSKLKLRNPHKAFRNTVKLETLQVVIEICPPFNQDDFNVEHMDLAVDNVQLSRAKLRSSLFHSFKSPDMPLHPLPEEDSVSKALPCYLGQEIDPNGWYAEPGNEISNICGRPGRCPSTFCNCGNHSNSNETDESNEFELGGTSLRSGRLIPPPGPSTLQIQDDETLD